jgi:multidrug efflux pump subunit AcrB
MVTGYSLLDSGFKTNAGTFFVTLKDFKERYASAETARAQNARAVLLTLFREAESIETAIVVPVAPPPIPGIGTTGGFEFWIRTRARATRQLDEVTQEFLKRRVRGRAHEPQHDVPCQHAAAPARSSIATRPRCLAFRSTTSTARSRRNSAR